MPQNALQIATPAPVTVMSPAADAVFSTVELLEEILGHLSPRELCRHNIVSRHWRDVISLSPRLQRNAFLASKFPAMTPLSENGLRGRKLDYCEFSNEDQGTVAVNPLVHDIFDTEVVAGQGLHRTFVFFNKKTGDVILDIGHAVDRSSQLIANIERVLGVNVEIPGWRLNERMQDTSWQRMLVVDPPATKVLMVLGHRELYFFPQIRYWASPGLQMGELIDQVVAQLLVDKDEMDRECGNGLLISDTTRHRQMWSNAREIKDSKIGLLA
ncbi:uncharacterized protein BDZ99DRAFT_93462 [Mytilinidion resinicola]|uniref:F-box domain-containing protein n=1 Tax=Mytilinidion resinicola TaxID=574789 RepID=A0A6A6YCH2_9PEZI|nr:uncharacterized protein BDZ99DRAFT_93462 [Mytilinidion resinicola]KAF2806299.1 hypothetical protein BDZ99DRAFT_93462 [Mytilinidion resinicola]